VAKLVTVQLTNGFGNNIFQYTAARQLAEHLGCSVVAVPPTADYYAIADLDRMGMSIGNPTQYRSAPATYQVTENNYLKTFDNPPSNDHIHLVGYFEDYRFYINNIETIRSWFPQPKPREDNALVLHMRTGDRLFMKNEFYSKPRVENYVEAIKQFEFDEFHIVTDMPDWRPVTSTELEAIKFHLHTPTEKRVPIEESVTYFNELVEGLAQFNPHVVPRTVGEDFNFIRKFKNILFEHGTLSWWAAVLSDAKKVGVYGPWRPWKGASNKNLSQIPLKGWFKWE